MPQHASFSTSTYGISLCSSSFEQVVADARLVVVDVAGREDRDLARRALAVARPATPSTSAPRRAEARRRVAAAATRRGATPSTPSQHLARRRRRGSPRSPPARRPGCRRACRCASVRRRAACRAADARRLRELDRLGAQHQVREVDVPRMRRHVRALGHVAHVAQVALVDDLPVVLLGDAVDLARRRCRRPGRTASGTRCTG